MQVQTVPSLPLRPAVLWPCRASESDRAAQAGLHLESIWRQAPVATEGDSGVGSILASRWTDGRMTARMLRSTAPRDRYVIAITLRPVRIRLGMGGSIFDGTMPTGMVHVVEPGQTVEAEFLSPCDFIHYHVAAGMLRDCQTVGSTGPQSAHDDEETPGLRNLLVRDELAVQLSRTLTEDRVGRNPLYVENIGQTILMRILARRPSTPSVSALPKWRLRRVLEHVAANLSEPISLTDLAAAAGLSRMHFAAQFRVATGCRPHDYLLQHRIEQAKEMLTKTNTPLVEVAMNTGFQTQSHFSTVFKRLAGDTPARWQRNQKAA